MPECVIEGVTARWDPERRLVALRYAPGCSPSGFGAMQAILVLERWTGASAPYVVLVDGEGASGAGIQWRMRLAEHFRINRFRVRIACHNLSPVRRMTLRAWARRARVKARSFPSEAAARAWLLQEPVAVAGAALEPSSA